VNLIFQSIEVFKRVRNPRPPSEHLTVHDPARTTTAALIPRFFVLLAFSFGIAYLVLLPPNQVPDEVKHLARSISVASGHCVGETLVRVPHGVQEMSQAFPSALDRTRPTTRWLTFDNYKQWLKPASQSPESIMDDFPATLYTCVPYLPSALAVKVAGTAAWPPLILYYAGRLANLTTFIILVYTALVLLHDFQLQLCGLALMPMTLSQAASFSADAVTLGISFLFIAYVLRLTYDERIVEIRRADWVALCILSACCALTKFNLWLELLVFFIPSRKFSVRRHRVLFIGGNVLVAFGSALLWAKINSTNTQVFIRTWLTSRGIDVKGNASWLYIHPGLFLSDIWHSVSATPGHYLTMFVGMMGYLTMPLPAIQVVAYLICLLFIAVTQTVRTAISLRQRICFTLLFLASFVSVFALLFNFEVHMAYIHARPPVVGDIPGVQGRYFIPFAVLALLSFSNLRLRVDQGKALALLLGVSGIANTTGLNLIWKEFYEHAAVKKLDGEAVRADHGPVFFLLEGTLHPVATEQPIEKLGLRSGIRAATAIDIRSLPVGPPMPLVSSRLLLDEERGGGVFYIDGGLRHRIPDPATLIALRVPDPVLKAPPHVIGSIPLGMPVPHMDQDQDECVVTSDGRAFLKLKDTVRFIPDSKTLSVLHFGLRTRNVGDEEFKSLKMGANLPSLSSRLLLNPKVGVVFYIDGGVRHGIPDPETLQALRLDDPVVTAEESTVETIPPGSPLPHMDFHP
jgi:uncharacterized membrane protein